MQLLRGLRDENVEKLLDLFIDEIKKGTDEETLFKKLQQSCQLKISNPYLIILINVWS